MSEDEHRRIAAQDEAGDEAETEAHGRVAANEEAADEAEGDDVEAHQRRVT